MDSYEVVNLKNATLYRVEFPEFWERACREKNAYYQRIAERVKKREYWLRARISDLDNDIISEADKNGGKLLNGVEISEDERLALVWHDEFCYYFEESIPINEPCVAYCMKDMDIWVCEDCFNDFKELEGWVARPVEELFD